VYLSDYHILRQLLTLYNKYHTIFILESLTSEHIQEMKFIATSALLFNALCQGLFSPMVRSAETRSIGSCPRTILREQRIAETVSRILSFLQNDHTLHRTLLEWTKPMVESYVNLQDSWPTLTTLALSEYYAAVFKDGEDVLDTIHVLLGLVTILKIGRGRMF